MKQKTQKSRAWAKRKLLAVASAVLFVSIITSGAVISCAKIHEYQQAADEASIVSVRELILLAMRGLKKDAPVDPRTGDIYFPESRLYLPNPHQVLAITYLVDSGDVTDSQSELSISSYPVRGTTALYTAQNSQQLFAAVPKLQACSRGIKIVHRLFPSTDTQNELKQTVDLHNGQTAYIYLEKDCPELNDVANLFKNLRAY